MADVSLMKLPELICFAEQQAELEHNTPSLIEADSLERCASWAATLEVLRFMQQQGMPEAFQDESEQLG